MQVHAAVSRPNPLLLTPLERSLLAELRSGNAPLGGWRWVRHPFRPDREGRRGLRVVR